MLRFTHLSFDLHEGKAVNEISAKFIFFLLLKKKMYFDWNIDR